jgi:hypothetical protein
VIIDLVLAAAIAAAVVAFWLRRRRRVRLRVAARARPGSSAGNPIYVRSYAEIDDHLAGRWCHCGGYLERRGEGTRDTGGRRFRVARLACQECEEVAEVVFETTDVLH